MTLYTWDSWIVTRRSVRMGDEAPWLLAALTDAGEGLSERLVAGLHHDRAFLSLWEKTIPSTRRG